MIISFLELFLATCFLCILQTQLTRRNTSFPKNFKKRLHMTFMMTSSNDGKSDICQFFIKTYSILSIQYMYKVSCKMDKHFLRCSTCFHHGPSSTPLPQPWDFQKKASPDRIKIITKFCHWTPLKQLLTFLC